GQALEVRLDLLGSADPTVAQRLDAGPLHRLLLGVTGVGEVGHVQIGAAGAGVEEHLDPLAGVLVPMEVHHQADDHEAHGTVEVDRLLDVRVVQDAAGVAQVRGGDHRGVVVRQQGPAVREHDRVVVDVADLRVGVDRLGHLVRVLHGGQAGADVEELVDALPSHVPHPLSETAPVVLAGLADVGHVLLDHGGPFAVHREVVLAAEGRVVDAGDGGPADVELGGGGRVFAGDGGGFFAHRHNLFVEGTFTSSYDRRPLEDSTGPVPHTRATSLARNVFTGHTGNSGRFRDGVGPG